LEKLKGDNEDQRHGVEMVKRRAPGWRDRSRLTHARTAR
jgi:hypothetical protein